MKKIMIFVAAAMMMTGCGMLKNNASSNTTTTTTPAATTGTTVNAQNAGQGAEVTHGPVGPEQPQNRGKHLHPVREGIQLTD